MGNLLPENLEEAINQLSRLPGIGPKSAERLAFHLLKSPKGSNNELSDAVRNIKEGIQLCKECFLFTVSDVCHVCSDSRRDKGLLCVVEEALDLIAVEKTHEYNGYYHVLHGHISPLQGIGPDDLTIQQLLRRIKSVALELD